MRKYKTVFFFFTLCHEISFSQPWTSFNTLIHESPVGVKELFPFFCVTYRLNLVLNYQVKMEEETGFSRLALQQF